MSDDAVTPDIDAPWSPGSLTIIKSFFVSVTVEHHELCFLFAHAAEFRTLDPLRISFAIKDTFEQYSCFC